MESSFFIDVSVNNGKIYIFRRKQIARAEVL